MPLRTLAYGSSAKTAGICFVANLDRRDNKNKGKAESDDTLASLMDQYVASTREPVSVKRPVIPSIV